VVWVSLAVAFGFLLSAWRGPEDAQLFAAGYVLELALSVDNLFIFILVFAHFKIPDHLQHRVLFWGIIGAVAMRALFIIAGVAAVESFTWMLPIFGAFLLFTGVKLAVSHDEHEGKGMDENLFVKVARKFFPLTPHLHGNKFWVKEDGVRRFTPLFLVLLVVEGTDLIFAIDSIPAVLGILPPNLPIEEKRFVAFTSNIFAIMGLRSMYFALAGFMQYFRFLKPALAFVLVFIGIKMILPWAAALGQPEGRFASWMPARFIDHGRVHFPTELSLAVHRPDAWPWRSRSRWRFRRRNSRRLVFPPCPASATLRACSEAVPRLYLPYLKGSRLLLALSLLSAIVFAAANAFGLPFLMGKVLPAVFGDEAARAAPLLSWPEALGGGVILRLPKGHEMLFAVAFLPVVMLIRGLGEFFSPTCSTSPACASSKPSAAMSSAACSRCTSVSSAPLRGRPPGPAHQRRQCGAPRAGRRLQRPDRPAAHAGLRAGLRGLGLSFP
jgi:tellurite resistance protein TerC